MKDKFLNLKLPDKYIEGLVKYEEGLDNIPEWIDLQKKGWAFEEYLKLEKLIEIEYMKYHLNEYKEDDEIELEEIKEAEQLIEKAIKEYNEM